MSIKTIEQAQNEAWKNRHWSRKIFKSSYSYASEEENDAFVDDPHIKEIVDFLNLWSKFENNPHRLYKHLLVIYAIRNQPWNLSFPYDITEREELFWKTDSNKKKFEMAQRQHNMTTCVMMIRKMIDMFLYYFEKEKKF